MELVNALEAQVRLSSEKIRVLLRNAEVQATRAERERAALAERLHRAELELLQLGPLVDLVRTEISQDPNIVRHQLEIYRSYVQAMGSPGHRLVTFLGKRTKQNALARTVRKGMNFLIAVRQA